MAVADDEAVAFLVKKILPGGDPVSDLGVDGRCQHLMGPGAEQLRQYVPGRGLWQTDAVGGRLIHGGGLLCLVVLAQDTPPSFCAHLIHNIWSYPVATLKTPLAGTAKGSPGPVPSADWMT